MSFDPRAFVEVLRELRDHPDRAIIQALTMAAYDVAFDAAAVRHLSTLLQTEVHGAPPKYKLPILYTIDSILRSARGGSYAREFEPIMPRMMGDLYAKVPIEQQPKLLALLGVWTSAGLFLHSMKAIHAAMVQPVPVPPAPAAQYLDSDRYRTQPPPQYGAPTLPQPPHAPEPDYYERPAQRARMDAPATYGYPVPRPTIPVPEWPSPARVAPAPPVVPVPAPAVPIPVPIVPVTVTNPVATLSAQAVRALYDWSLPQCVECGQRIPDEEQMVSHKEWHVLQAARAVNKGEMARAWYLPRSSWVSAKSDGQSSTVSSYFKEMEDRQKEEEAEATPDVGSFVPVEDVTGEGACYICGDKFSKSFDDSVNAWVYVGAAMEGALLFHPSCKKYNTK